MTEYLAGAFYLLNKIFFAYAEHNKGEMQESKWRIRAWGIYLCGLPFWLVIFARESNWIAFFVEAGGAPSMILGLIIAWRGKGKEPDWLNIIALLATLIGLVVSVIHFNGITRVEQWLELVLAIGFLGGTFLLAKQIPQGYIFFMAMNLSNTCLMAIQGYPWLSLQQILSFGAMVYAYRLSKKRR